MNKPLFRLAAFLSLLGSVLMMSAPAARADVTFDLGTFINGTLAPAGSTPWVTATFHDVAPGDVVLTVTNTMPAGQFVDQFVFDSIIDPTTLAFNNLTTPPPLVISLTTSPTQSLTGGANMKAGLFNVWIDYATADAGRFKGGMVSVWNITGTGLTSSNFLLRSIDDGHMVNGPYYMAAHVQGIPVPGDGTTSASIGAIPEPETYAMLLLGLGFMGFVMKRRNAGEAV